MKNYKKAKKMMLVFCIIAIVLAIFFGKSFENLDKVTLNIPFLPVDIPKNMYMELFIIPLIIFPLIIVFILAYYDNILSGIVLVGYEMFVLLEYIHFNTANYDYPSLTIFVFIPIIIGIIYILTYMKNNNIINKNSR